MNPAVAPIAIFNLIIGGNPPRPTYDGDTLSNQSIARGPTAAKPRPWMAS